MGQLREWRQVPSDNAIGDETKQFLAWLMTVANQVQPALFPPQSPTVTTVSHPGAVLVVWNEVKGAVSYAAYETSSQAAPPGVPFATVPANIGAMSNAVLRPNLNDTVTRYYSVVAIGQNSRSAISTATPGAALAVGATIIPVSGTAVNQGGVGGGVGGGGGIFGLGSRIQP